MKVIPVMSTCNVYHCLDRNPLFFSLARVITTPERCGTDTADPNVDGEVVPTSLCGTPEISTARTMKPGGPASVWRGGAGEDHTEKPHVVDPVVDKASAFDRSRWWRRRKGTNGGGGHVDGEGDEAAKERGGRGGKVFGRKDHSEAHASGGLPWVRITLHTA